MSKQTTPRQRMAAMVREHFADTDTTITESKFLTDRVTGEEREVDVVIQGWLAGDEITIGVEVVDRSRPMSVGWVDSMIGKHESLPTDRLILVSWSGFAASAIAKAQAHGIAALTPKHHGDAPALYVDQIRFTLVRCLLTFETPEGGAEILDAAPEVAIFAADGSAVGTRVDLVRCFMDMTRDFVAAEVHNYEDRPSVDHLTVGDRDFGRFDLYLAFNEDGPTEFLKIVEVTCTLSFKFAQTELAFALMELDGKKFAAALARLFDQDVVWIATQRDDDPSLANVSYRTVDAPSEPRKGLRGRD